MMKNKLNDKIAEAKQYEHEAPSSLVARVYKKYPLAAAMEAETGSKSKRPSLELILRGTFHPPSFKPRRSTSPYAVIPINGSGTPGTCKRVIIESSFKKITCSYFKI